MVTSSVSHFLSLISLILSRHVYSFAFYEGKVKHIFFIAETKGTMESLELRPIERAKISCAKKLFNEMSTSNVVYHDVDSYQSLLNIMNSL